MFLDNGLKVVTAAQPGNPMVSARLIIKSGSGAEYARGDYGLAHLIEHMAFKSTAKRAEGDLAWEIESAGGLIGAYTWLDETVYHLTLPAEALEMGLDVLADMVFAPACDPEELEREKEVVLEEISKYADLPADLLADNLYRMAFGAHPYGHPVLGLAETVKAATTVSIRAFLNRHYRPDNAVLVITGGFDEEMLAPAVEKHFGQVEKPAEAPAGPAGPLIDDASPARVKIAVSPKSALALVEIAFKTWPADDPRLPTAEMLAGILSQSQTSRLDETVKTQKALVTSIGSGLSVFRDGGLFSVYLETEPELVEKAVGAVLAELKKIIKSAPDEDELIRVKALSASAFLAQQDNSDGLGRIIGEFENTFGDCRLREARLAQWNQVTADDLVKVARQLFQPGRLYISAILPQKAESRAAGLENKLSLMAQGLSTVRAGLKKTAPPPVFEVLDLGRGGPRLLFLKDSTLPQVIFKAGAVGGQLAEGPGDEGLSGLMAELWPLAAAGRPRAEFLRAAERLGAEFSATSGRNSLFLSGRAPAGNFAAAFELLAEAVRRPAFDADDLEEARRDRLADLKQQLEDPSARCALLARRGLYGPGHPFGRNPLGREDLLESFTQADLLKFHGRLIRPSVLTLAVAGDIDRQSVQAAAEAAFSGWAEKSPARSVKPAAQISAPFKAGRASEIMERAQAHLRLSFPAPGLGHDDQAALELLAEYLGGGMAGPLFLELRDKRALAYDVYAHYLPGLGAGEVSFYLAVDPSKTRAALDGLAEIIDAFKTRGLDSETLIGSIRQTLGRRKRGEESLADRAEAALLWSLYGLGLDFEEKYQAKIKRLKAGALKKCAVKYLDWEKAVTALVGPEAL